MKNLRKFFRWVFVFGMSFLTVGLVVPHNAQPANIILLLPVGVCYLVLYDKVFGADKEDNTPPRDMYR